MPLAPPLRRRGTLPLVTSAPALSSLATAPNSARERHRRVEGAQEDSGRVRVEQAVSPAPSSSNSGVRGRGGRNTDNSLLTIALAASTTAAALPPRRTSSRMTATADTASTATASTTTSSHATTTTDGARPPRRISARTAVTTTTTSTASTGTSSTSGSTSASTNDITTTAGSTAGARTGSTPIAASTTSATATNLLWRGEATTSASARSKRRSTRSTAAGHDGHHSPPTASSSPRSPTTNSVRATSGPQAPTEPLAQSLAPPPPAVASTSILFPGKWVESGAFECGVDGCGRRYPGARECSGCSQSIRTGWAFGAGRDSVTEIKLLDEVTFRGRNGFAYTGLIVALNGSTEIFPDGSALVKHSDTLYNRDRFGEDVAMSCITPPGCTGGSAKRVRTKVDRLMNSFF